MKRIFCDNCRRELCDDEIALNLKLLGKHIGTFRCYECLAVWVGCDAIKLKQMTEHYKRSGCILFQINYTQ